MSIADRQAFAMAPYGLFSLIELIVDCGFVDTRPRINIGRVSLSTERLSAIQQVSAFYIPAAIPSDSDRGSQTLFHRHNWDYPGRKPMLR